MQNALQKFRQSSIVFEKPGICLKIWKLQIWNLSSNYPKVQYFLLKLLLQKIYEKPKVSIQIIKNAKSLNTNNQKCKKEQVQTNEWTLIL